MSVTVHRTMYRSSTSLLLRPLQEWPLRDLIKLLIPIATMLSNMLNDLAEAMKALEGKKHNKTPKQKNNTHKNKHQHKPPSSDVTVPAMGEKDQLRQEVIA